jgi:hypothetical protein
MFSTSISCHLTLGNLYLILFNREDFLMTHISINTNVDAGTISRHIYGHCAEHLGRCIYDGLFVGESSPIANTRGIRNDVVEAHPHSQFALARRLFCR